MSYPYVSGAYREPSRLRSLLCRLRRHHDYVSVTPHATTPLLLCLRCGKTGWWL